MDIDAVGAACFGWVIGWVTYRTLRRREGNAAMSDIATVIGAVGGGAVTALWPAGSGGTFSWYSIGLFIGFFLYYLVGVVRTKVDGDGWMLE